MAMLGMLVMFLHRCCVTESLRLFTVVILLPLVTKCRLVVKFVSLRLPSALVLRCAGYLSGRCLLKSRMFALFMPYGVMLMFGTMVVLFAFRGFTSVPRFAKYMMLRFRVVTLTGMRFVVRDVLIMYRVLVVRVTCVIVVMLMMPFAMPEVVAIMMVCAFGIMSWESLLTLRCFNVLYFVRVMEMLCLVVRWPSGCSIEPRLSIAAIMWLLVFMTLPTM